MIKKAVTHLLQFYRKKDLKACGSHSYIARNCFLCGNIYLGSNVHLGQGNYFVSTLANIHIHDHVIFGPNVTIYTGDHPTNVIGKHISELKDSDKDSCELDQDVIIESGCWIGARAIILKGVTVGRGSVIGAGAVVTKDVPPYSVYVGVPPARTFPRFSAEEIQQHEECLMLRGMQADSMRK